MKMLLRFGFTVLAAMLCVSRAQAGTDSNAPATDRIDSRSLRGKVLCGYQGWFRCPGDGANQGWIHWSRDSQRITPETLTFEMWPDLSEFPVDERFPAPGFTDSAGATRIPFQFRTRRDGAAPFPVDAGLRH